MEIRILALAPALVAAGRAETVSKLWPRGYAVIPDPQQVELRDGNVWFGLKDPTLAPPAANDELLRLNRDNPRTFDWPAMEPDR
jgi:hypothetical protein